MREIASFFELELDTTPPDIEILSPSYTTNVAPIEVIIEANEELSSFQNVYLVDNNGNSHPLTFSHQGSYLKGIIKPSMIPVGVTTIYAQVKDTVDNISNLVSYTFNIIGGSPLSLKIGDTQATINIDSKSRYVTSSSCTRKVVSGIKEEVK